MGQLLITVGREYGSGGREIAEKLGQRLGIMVYDRNMLDELQQRYGFDRDVLVRSEESPVNVLFSRKIRGFSSSVEEVVARREFELIDEKAEEGQSFIVVGRCAEQVLKNRPNLHTFFIRGQENVKCHRVMQRYNLSQDDALAKMHRMDHQRKAYHNYYCDGKWGDSRNYDLCVNSSALGIDGTVELLAQFLQLNQKKEEQ
jgi:cytidylate kinase